MQATRQSTDVGIPLSLAAYPDSSMKKFTQA